MMLLFAPFIVQAVALLFDEFYFHHKRGLPLWERLGHPLDTLSYLLCMGITLVFPYNEQLFWTYMGFSIFSCVLITKDEFIHKHHSSAPENWLHAFLFILHPIALYILWVVWSQNLTELKGWIWAQFGAIVCFCFYQIIFWNISWKPQKQ